MNYTRPLYLDTYIYYTSLTISLSKEPKQEGGTLHYMSESLASQCCLIILFWILVPTFDQYTDINLIQRLFRGPSDDTNISSCKLNKS